jgi:hypothetical protein
MRGVVVLTDQARTSNGVVRAEETPQAPTRLKLRLHLTGNSGIDSQR